MTTPTENSLPNIVNIFNKVIKYGPENVSCTEFPNESTQNMINMEAFNKLNQKINSKHEMKEISDKSSFNEKKDNLEAYIEILKYFLNDTPPVTLDDIQNLNNLIQNIGRPIFNYMKNDKLDIEKIKSNLEICWFKILIIELERQLNNNPEICEASGFRKYPIIIQYLTDISENSDKSPKKKTLFNKLIEFKIIPNDSTFNEKDQDKKANLFHYLYFLKYNSNSSEFTKYIDKLIELIRKTCTITDDNTTMQFNEDITDINDINSIFNGIFEIQILPAVTNVSNAAVTNVSNAAVTNVSNAEVTNVSNAAVTNVSNAAVTNVSNAAENKYNNQNSLETINNTTEINSVDTSLIKLYNDVVALVKKEENTEYIPLFDKKLKFIYKKLKAKPLTIAGKIKGYLMGVRAYLKTTKMQGDEEKKKLLLLEQDEALNFLINNKMVENNGQHGGDPNNDKKLELYRKSRKNIKGIEEIAAEVISDLEGVSDAFFEGLTAQQQALIKQELLQIPPKLVEKQSQQLQFFNNNSIFTKITEKNRLYNIYVQTARNISTNFDSLDRKSETEYDNSLQNIYSDLDQLVQDIQSDKEDYHKFHIKSQKLEYLLLELDEFIKKIEKKTQTTYPYSDVGNNVPSLEVVKSTTIEQPTTTVQSLQQKKYENTLRAFNELKTNFETKKKEYNLLIVNNNLNNNKSIPVNQFLDGIIEAIADYILELNDINNLENTNTEVSEKVLQLIGEMNKFNEIVKKYKKEFDDKIKEYTEKFGTYATVNPRTPQLEGVHNTYIEGGMTATKKNHKESLYMMTGQNAVKNNAMIKVKAITAKIEGFTRAFTTMKNEYQSLLRSNPDKDRIYNILQIFETLSININQYYNNLKINNVKNNNVNKSIDTLLEEIEKYKLQIEELYYTKTTLASEIFALDLEYKRIKSDYSRIETLHPNQKNNFKNSKKGELETLNKKIQKIIINIKKYKNHPNNNTVKNPQLENLQRLINKFITDLSESSAPPDRPPPLPDRPPPKLVIGGYKKTHKLQSKRNQKLKSNRKNNKTTKSTKHKMKMNTSKLKKTHKK
jgi:hypothetical protein